VLHSILFHRLFGCVKPQTFEILDVTFVCDLFLCKIHVTERRHHSLVSRTETSSRACGRR
jgi:hypothetical protein